MPRAIGIAHPRPAPNIAVANPEFFPPILQNTFRAIVHRAVHRPLCHEYLGTDRTTFSGLSSFYTVLWHITLKAICKITEFLTCLKHAIPGQPKFSLTFYKTPSAQSAAEPSTGHFVMNISLPVTPIGAAGEEGGSKCPIRIFFFIQNGCYFDIFRYLYER